MDINPLYDGGEVRWYRKYRHPDISSGTEHAWFYLYVVQVCGRGGQEVDVITHRVEPRLVVVVGPPEFQAYRNHGVRGRERHGPPFRSKVDGGGQSDVVLQ